MKKVLITGSSDGIGKEIVKQLDNDNYELFLFGRSEEKMNNLEVNTKHHKFIFDMLDEDKLYENLNTIKDMGGVEIVINNAGFNAGKDLVQDIKIDDLKKMLQLNAIDYLIVIQEMIPQMLEKGQGQIVNILSSVCKFNNPNNGAYTASKLACEALSKTLVKEVKDKGIKVLDVYPGGVDTSFRANKRQDYLRPETIAKHIVYAIENNDDGMIQEIVCRPIVESNY